MWCVCVLFCGGFCWFYLVLFHVYLGFLLLFLVVVVVVYSNTVKAFKIMNSSYLTFGKTVSQLTFLYKDQTQFKH